MIFPQQQKNEIDHMLISIRNCMRVEGHIFVFQQEGRGFRSGSSTKA